MEMCLEHRDKKDFAQLSGEKQRGKPWPKLQTNGVWGGQSLRGTSWAPVFTTKYLPRLKVH